VAGFHEAGVIGLARPYVQGTSLATIIRERIAVLRGKTLWKRHPLATVTTGEYIERILPVLSRVVEVVALLHEKNLIHGGLKPSNILIDDVGGVWLTDWGFAHLVSPWGAFRLGARFRSSLTESWETVSPDLRPAAPGFVSPEEWSGATEPDLAIDVFSLGVTLYQSLTLALPYGPSAISTRRPPSPAPSAKAPAIPASLDPILLKALHTNRAQRYSSAVELWRDWKQALSDLRRGPPPTASKPTPARTFSALRSWIVRRFKDILRATWFRSRSGS
jgi:serine/threonine-protein kinase